MDANDWDNRSDAALSLEEDDLTADDLEGVPLPGEEDA